MNRGFQLIAFMNGVIVGMTVIIWIQALSVR